MAKKRLVGTTHPPQSRPLPQRGWLRLQLAILTAMLLALRWLYTAWVAGEGAAGETCDFIILDGEVGLPNDNVYNKPFLMKNAFPWRDEFTTEDFARSNLGNITLKLTNQIDVQSANGIVPSPLRMRMQEWMDASDRSSMSPFVFNWCRGSCIRKVTDAISMPESGLMSGFEHFFLSAGLEGPGIGLHQHAPTWVAQLSGTKTWSVAPPGRAPVQPFKNYGANEAGSRFKRCTQHPGELVFLPDSWWHSTQNLGWSLAVGGQGDNRHIPRNYRRVVARAAMGNVSYIQNADFDSEIREEDADLFITAMWWAALSNGHLGVINFLSNTPPDIKTLKSGFFFAVKHGHVELSSWFLKKAGSDKAHKILKDKFPEAALEAAANSDEDIFDLLLKARAAVHAPGSHRQPLHNAAQFGHERMVQFLLAKRASTTDKDEFGRTPLQIASGQGKKPGEKMFKHTRVMQLLQGRHAQQEFEL